MGHHHQMWPPLRDVSALTGRQPPRPWGHRALVVSVRGQRESRADAEAVPWVAGGSQDPERDPGRGVWRRGPCCLSRGLPETSVRWLGERRLARAVLGTDCPAGRGSAETLVGVTEPALESPLPQTNSIRRS